MTFIRNQRNARTTKFERPELFEHEFHKDILQSQQMDINGGLTDTVLVCNGGCVRVHAFILQTASPLVEKSIFSQGDSYGDAREILLPDFGIKEIAQMLELVYVGHTNLESEKDVQNLKETLKFFQISNVNFNCEEELKKIKNSLKVQDLNRIPQEIFKFETKIESVEPDPVLITAVVKQVSKPPAKPLRRSGRAAKLIKKNLDADYQKDSTAESSDEDSSTSESDDEKRKPVIRRGRHAGATVNKVNGQPLPAVRITRVVETPKTIIKSPPASGVTVTRVDVNSPDKPTTPVKKDGNSSTDTEDEGWVKPNYKDMEWFTRESRRCQACSRSFEKPADASLCITSHKSLRCYFCFKVFSTTDKLFRHFSRRHKQAGRESTLVCPYCDQAVPYKSVSCHVISCHLKNKPEESETPTKPSTLIASKPKVGPKSEMQKVGKQLSFSSSTSSSNQKRLNGESHTKPPPSKKSKSETSTSGEKTERQTKLTEFKGKKVLKVPDLDVTIEKTSRTGRLLVIRLQKKRPV